MTQEDVILTATGIEKSYWLGRVRQHVLRGVNLQVRRGEFAAIMGASGSGKSTFLHILGLLDKADKGQVTFEGRDTLALKAAEQNRLRNCEIGFVFQFYHLLPELNVEENVMLPLMVSCSTVAWWGQRQKAKQRVKDILAAVGLEEKHKQRPATLSGGERQRAAIARALISEPKVLLADEPTGNLDSASGKVILDLLTRLNEQGQSIIMVTHDASVAERADRRLSLRDGIID